MEVIIQPDQDAVARLASQIIAKDLRANAHLVLGLATGRIMEALYQSLVEKCKTDKPEPRSVKKANYYQYQFAPLATTTKKSREKWLTRADKGAK